MRISGYGAGTGGGDNRRQRREAFRRRHAVGQRVAGVYLRPQDEELSWVEIDGMPLLAQLSGTPRPGQWLFFVIRQLEPEIVLQILSPNTQTNELPDLAQGFWTERQQFEGQSRDLAPELAPLTSPGERKARFHELLARNPAAAEAHATLLAALERLNRELAARNAGRALALPWLLPGAGEQELLLRPAGEGLQELVFSFRLPAPGCGELRVLFRPDGRGSFRLLLERPEQLEALLALLHGDPGRWWSEALGGELGVALDLEDAGLAALPQGPRSPLAGMVADKPLPRFSLRI